MARPAHPESLGPMRSARFPRDVDEALLQFADKNTGGNVAEALRLVVKQALGHRPGLSGLSSSMKSSGYNAGLRAGLAEARSALATALNELWRPE